MSQMPRFALGITALFFALSVSPAALAQTPEQYGSLPDVDDVEISPDGETLAIIKSFGSTGAVLFYDLDNMGAQPVGVGLGESKPRTIEWADNENLLLLASQAERKRTTDGIETIEFFRWLSISPEEGKANLLFGNAAGYYQSSAGTLLSTLPSKPGKAVFQRSSITYRTDGRASRFDNDDEFKLSLFEVDLARGREKNIESGNEETVDWVIDAEGAPVARIDYDWSAAERKVYIADGRSWVLNSSLPEERSDLAVASFYGMGSRPQTMLATTYGARDKRSLVEYDIATGSFTNTLFANPTYDIDYVVYNPSLATADAVVYTDDLPRAKYLDPELQSVQDSLVKALPGAAPMIVSRTDDDMKMIVKAIYTDHPPQYFLFDRNAKKLNMIAPTYPALDGKVQAVKSKYDYQSSDGLTIHGYLTAPKGADKNNMPLIVLPHGGPESRDDQAFDWWASFYAARGYLVYQPNFRGSSGYGAAFVSAGLNQWGLKMQDDITEGVNKLVADGYADPERICIVGGSYGGYAALAGATLTPDLYQCVVSVAGISNLPLLLSEAGKDSIWEKRIGNRFEDSEYINSISPAKNAENVTAPVLLLHGDQDVVVPINQSRQMEDALQKAGKPVEFVVLKDEDHWLSRSETRTEMLARSIEFIDRHIGNAN